MRSNPEYTRLSSIFFPFYGGKARFTCTEATFCAHICGPCATTCCCRRRPIEQGRPTVNGCNGVQEFHRRIVAENCREKMFVEYCAGWCVCTFPFSCQHLLNQNTPSETSLNAPHARRGHSSSLFFSHLSYMAPSTPSPFPAGVFVPLTTAPMHSNDPSLAQFPISYWCLCPRSRSLGCTFENNACALL